MYEVIQMLGGRGGCSREGRSNDPNWVLHFGDCEPVGGGRYGCFDDSGRMWYCSEASDKVMDTRGEYGACYSSTFWITSLMSIRSTYILSVALMPRTDNEAIAGAFRNFRDWRVSFFVIMFDVETALVVQCSIQKL